MVQQLSSQQLAALPAGQTLAPTSISTINTQLAEAGTAQLVSQSLYHLKDYPNPELVSEAVSTGATQDVASALSDPTLGQYMTVTPGSSTAIPKGPDNGPGLPGANLDSFDWNAYWGGNNQQQLKENPQFQALGVVPQMNIAWMNGVMNHSDPKTTMQWQHWLTDHGTLSNHAADGHWDDATKAAFQAYMLMLVAPDALWSKNPQRQAQASNFMGRLGIPVDSWSQAVGKSTDMQRSVVLGWMQMQDNANPQDTLARFADNYGNDKLTAAQQQIVSGGSFWDHILNAMSAINPMHLVDLLGHVATNIDPFMSEADKAKANAAQTRLENLTNPTYQQAQGVMAQLKQEGFTPQEQAAMQPAINQLANNTGFLPIEWFDQKTSQLFLTAWYSLDAGAGGSAGHHLSNPFDALNPQSDLGQRIAAHVNNLAGAIYGDQFAAQHQTISTLTAGMLHTLDDPITYLGGFAARAPALFGDVAKAVKGQEVIDQATGLGVQASMGAATRAALDRFFNPKAEMQRVMSIGLYNVRHSPSLIQQSLRYTDDLAAGVAGPKFKQAMDAIANAQSVDEVRTVLNGPLGFMFHSPAYAMNARDARQALSHTVTTAQGAEHVLNMRVYGSFRETGLAQDFARPHDLQQVYEQMLSIAGSDDAEMGKLMDEWIQTPDAERSDWHHDTFIERLDQLIAEKFPGDSLQGAIDHARVLAKGRSYVFHPGVEEALGPRARVAEVAYMPAQRGTTQIDPATKRVYEPGAEMSKAPRKFPEGTQLYLQKQQQAVETLDEGWRQAVDDYVRREIIRHPTARTTPAELVTQFRASTKGRALETEHDEQIARIQASMNEVTGGLGTQRAMPALPGQLQRKIMMPVTPYELYIYLNRKTLLGHMEEVAAHVRADAFYSIWKGITLSRVSTALRVLIGDDTTRFLVYMAANGHPLSAMRAFAQATGLGAYGGLGQGVASLARGTVGRIPGAAQAAEDFAGVTGLSRFSPRAVRARADAINRQLGAHDIFTYNKEINESDDTMTRPYDPAEEAITPGVYKRAFRDNFRAIWANSPISQEWAQIRYGMDNALTAKHGKGDAAAERYLRDVALGKAASASSDDLAHILKQLRAGKPVDKEFAATWAASRHDWLRTLTQDRELLRWGAEGKIDGKVFDRHFKEHRALYPIVAAPRQTVFSNNFFVNAMKQGPGQVFRATAEPMIYIARAEGAWRLKQMYEKYIEAHNTGGYWTGEEISALASSQAISWMRDNLYNGQRTLLGRSLRHVFPFGGAVTNMRQFYMRQMHEHPWLVDPLVRYGSYAEQQAANNQDTALLINHNILSAIGFSGSAGMTGNLAHSFFVTSDGIGSIIPGVGPIFTPVLSFVAQDQNIRDLFQNVPGIREQLQFAAGRNTGANPLQTIANDLLPTWLSDQIDAVGLISPLHSPILAGLTGTGEDYKRLIDLKGKQLYADYLSNKRDAPPTQDDILSSVGSDLLAGGVVGDILPITPKVVDERAQLLKQFQTQYSAAKTPAQQKAVLDATKQAGKTTGFDVTPLMLYYDPRTSLAEQDQLKNDNQWIVPYTTSMYETAGPKPSTLSEYDNAIANGDLHALGLGELIPNITGGVQSAYLWVQYQNIRNAQATFLQANGLTTSSPEYKDYMASTINPLIQQLETQGQNVLLGNGTKQTWTDQFLKSTSTTVPGLTANTIPLRGVATWDVLPISSNLENGTTIAWRKALTNMQEASSTLAGIRASGGSKADEQAIIDGLATQLQSIAATDPGFARQLQYYSFTKFEDIVNLQTQMDAPNYGTGA